MPKTKRLTPKLALDITRPYSFSAALTPVLLAIALAAVQHYPVSVLDSFVLACISVLMQASVNTFNNYYDYKRGNDTLEHNIEYSNTEIIHENVELKQVFWLAIGLLVAAFVLGAYVIWIAGWFPLAVAAVGALVVVTYSAGWISTSYLPVGEIISGFTMGSLIPLASFQVLTGVVDFHVLLISAPIAIGIALIMMANNICDIERDTEVGRKTLPIVIGRARAVKMYRALIAAWVAAIAIVTAVAFPAGLIVFPFMLICSYPAIGALWGNPFTHESRLAAMAQIASARLALDGFFCAGVFAAAALSLTF